MAKHKVVAKTDREANQQLLLAMLALQQGGLLILDKKITEMFADESVELFLEDKDGVIEITAEIVRDENGVNNLKM